MNHAGTFGGVLSIMLGVSLAALAETTNQEVRSAAKLPEILVTVPETEKSEDLPREYTVEKTTMGTKTETPILEVPRTVNVVSRDLMEDQGATIIEDVLFNVAGAQTAFGAGAGGNLTLRGFSMSGWGAPFSYPIYFNGLRGQPYGGFSAPRLYNVEQVEVLKGPASVLYGSADPGGVINFVSRTPQSEPSYELEGTYGSYDLYRAHGHATGPLDSKKSLLYLLDLGYENAGSFRDNVETENLQITPALSWLVSDKCRIDFEFGYIYDRRDGQTDRGIPAVNGEYFVLPNEFNSNDPWDYTETTAYYGETHLRLKITDSLSLYSGLRVFSSENEQHFHFPGTLDTTTWMLPRTFSDSKDEQDGLSSDTHLLWETGQNEVKNQLLGGVEVTKSHDDRRSMTASQGVPGIYIWDPVYDDSTEGYVFNTPTLTDYEMLRLGGYAHDQITFCERLHLTAGARYDTYETEQTDPNGISPTYKDDGGAWTYNSGVLYDLVKSSKTTLNDLSVYTSYGECYQPQSQPRYASGAPASAKSQTFDPLTGWQVEAGIKGAWLDNKVTTAIALFHVEQENILAQDVTDPTGYTFDTIGAQESDGVEVQLGGRLTDSWTISANYAYTDTEITKDSNPDNVGDRMPNVAEHQAGLWTRYDFWDPGLAVFGGITYVGEREPFSGFGGDPYPDYTKVDAGVSYTFKRMTVKVDVNNVFDEEYILGGRGKYGYIPGAPRTFAFTTSVKF